MSFSSRLRGATRTGLTLVSASAVAVVIYSVLIIHAVEDALDRRARGNDHNRKSR